MTPQYEWKYELKPVKDRRYDVMIYRRKTQRVSILLVWCYPSQESPSSSLVLLQTTIWPPCFQYIIPVSFHWFRNWVEYSLCLISVNWIRECQNKIDHRKHVKVQLWTNHYNRLSSKSIKNDKRLSDHIKQQTETISVVQKADKTEIY